jgi:hypothetical protein
VRLERTWGVTVPSPSSPLEAELSRCADEWEAGLRQIDLPGVTDEDRATMLEHVVSWQIRRALRAGRFDLALAVRALGLRRIADLVERPGFHPVLLYGDPTATEGRSERARLRASPASRT